MMFMEVTTMVNDNVREVAALFVAALRAHNGRLDLDPVDVLRKVTRTASDFDLVENPAGLEIWRQTYPIPGRARPLALMGLHRAGLTLGQIADLVEARFGIGSAK
jgi:purine nucleoside permease